VIWPMPTIVRPHGVVASPAAASGRWLHDVSKNQAKRRTGFSLPWSALCGLTEPVYPKPGNGRPPVGVERMLRIYFPQQWFNLSDPAVEEALYGPV